MDTLQIKAVDISEAARMNLLKAKAGSHNTLIGKAGVVLRDVSFKSSAITAASMN